MNKVVIAALSLSLMMGSAAGCRGVETSQKTCKSDAESRKHPKGCPTSVTPKKKHHKKKPKKKATPAIEYTCSTPKPGEEHCRPKG